MSKTVTVTIGLPVYNGETLLRLALDSLLAQTFGDFLLHASDDLSSDASRDILEDYAASDPRLRLTFQKQNLGVFGNAHFLVSTAETPFYMMAAQDDEWAPTFLEKNLAALMQDPLAVGSISKVAFRSRGQFVQEAAGTFALTGESVENLREFIRRVGCNSRYYSLFRTDILKKSFPPFGEARYCHAFDWLVTGLTLLHGRHLELEETLLFREVAERDRYNHAVDRDENGLLGRLFPVMHMSRLFWRKLDRKQRQAVLPDLIRLNLYKNQEYVAYRWPRLRKVWRPGSLFRLR